MRRRQKKNQQPKATAPQKSEMETSPEQRTLPDPIDLDVMNEISEDPEPAPAPAPEVEAKAEPEKPKLVPLVPPSEGYTSFLKTSHLRMC